ncbi:ABC transporter ATP-binding protein/permease [Paenibacillus tianjinensis]|uniref:ATP-binding cassette domain-containing protein n=1 Tax=Paenibacillus tianjinensis TaxID=2810347 RepID=A0ABX7LBA0_9BACL|nr:ABC transporter ATP-binding protein/permease [Paenibacillus tianjinensis]QSF43735.1 ATP-binding cassette domain-containing protein [Paenibacillus tianjinensis]
MLQLKNISKSYTTGSFTQIALNDVNLDFRKNEFVAILGPSGSGKTTCLNLIGGLDQYDSGDLIINGTSTKHFKDSDWDAYRNNSVGFIFQSYNLISHLSITDNVEMGMTLSGVSAEIKHRKAVEALEKVGLKEHIHKKPGQLSGGQMQRVAIARALANDPDIILADEPTGALDTVTSEQIMELIKEIAKDKLVVMVTHNPELAEAYADRTVQFRDGKVISDSNPPSEIQENTNYQLKKTAMSYFTALKLSGKNISTKKWRTALTAFASSIGIIGIALILSLSNGFDKQISSYESGALSNFPVTINESAASIDLSSRPSEDARKTDKEWTEFTSADEIYPYDPSANTVMHTNVLSEAYLNYLDGIDPALLDGVSYSRKVSMNILKSDGATAVPVDAASLNFTSYPDKPAGAEGSYLADYYDLLAGSLPEKSTDLVMVVDEYNRMSQSILEALGLDYKAANISFDNIVGREFKLIYNDDYYIESDGMFKLNGNAANLSTMYNSGNAVTLKISGIIRKQQDSPMSTMSAGIAYSDSLTEQFITNAKNSAIVKAQQQQDQVNVLTGKVFSQVSGLNMGGGGMGLGLGMRGSGSSTDPGSSSSKEDTLAALGAVATPASISLYPKDFEAKEGIVEYLDKWNEGRSDKEMIVYTDLAEMVTSLSSGIMDGITMVLIAFASISLVVSLIMIGIITYISVLERTKEIGVLRALGARKKDITRVFNAETCIIGSLSGLLGIGIAYLLTIPVNIILKSITELSNVAQLNPLHAFGLVVLSVGLTMLGGFIPAKFAAKKDPVVALRSE